MKRYWLFLLLVIGIIAPSAVFTPAFPPEKKRYSIVKPSRLYLRGTTNVNKFTCECEDQFVLQELEITDDTDAGARFKNARLSMMTRKFNCRNGKIDRDMQKALKAEEYPKIEIELLETRQKTEGLQNPESDWFDIEAKVNVTITGVTKEKQIKAKAKKLSTGQFALKGSEALNMSEFSIVPPTAMFGLIKVNDQITFHFDLTIQLD
ncbi:MAG: YceI family protein [Saprospiraceae bacterium]